MRLPLLLTLLLTASFSFSQTYKYIDVQDGLSNQNVYAIQKDKKGYIWLLTMSGVDRFNGREFRNYRPSIGLQEPGPLFMLHRLHTDADGQVWLVSMREGIQRYDYSSDSFRHVASLPHTSFNKQPVMEIVSSYIDCDNRLWVLTGKEIFLWEIQSGRLTIVDTDVRDDVLGIVQAGTDSYAVATSHGLHMCNMSQGKLHSLCFIRYSDDAVMERVNAMLKCGGQILVGTDRHGLYVFDVASGSRVGHFIPTVCVNAMKSYGKSGVLIATDRSGVYKFDTSSMSMSPFMTADYDSPNKMDTNDIRDIYVDDEGRIWLASNPYGVTVLTNSLPQYYWLRHSSQDCQSIVNDNVNDVMEDSDGDIWFATDNGVSVLNPKKRQWQSLLNNLDDSQVFLTVREAGSGVVWAAGHSDKIYVIDKRHGMMTRTYRIPAETGNVRVDKYIQSALYDSDGYMWLGGCYGLKRIDTDGNVCRDIGLDFVSAIIEKDDDNLWVGTSLGLYIVNRHDCSVKRVRLSPGATYIYSLYQNDSGTLYVGTSCSGLIAYEYKKGTMRRYTSGNSTLITDNIHSIVADTDDKNLVLGTDRGLTRFDLKRNLFRNWTYDQGLFTTYFNHGSGIYTTDGYFVMGSNDGAVAFKINSWHDRPMKSKMVLSDMRIKYEIVRPGMDGSPLVNDIDETTELTLDYDQNIFSIDVSSINYDYPSDVAYTWRLLGFYDKWSRLDDESVIRYSGLPPGHYTLQIRAVSNEYNDRILEERSISIHIKPPFWSSSSAIVIYLLAFSLLCFIALRILIVFRHKRASAEKIRFFVNTAHDIRTPLTLIKAPLDDVRRNEKLSPDGTDNIDMAMRNVESLLRLTDNLINFERVAAYSGRICKSRHLLGEYVGGLVKSFAQYADAKGVRLEYNNNAGGLDVWLDREKMDSVLKNLLSNAIKYTPCGGSVVVSVCDNGTSWRVEVADTGIGIPPAERKRLFNSYYRATNAVNSKVTGSGIGLMLAKRIVVMHGGTISLHSAVGGGTVVTLNVPKRSKALDKAVAVVDVGHTPSDELVGKSVTDVQSRHSDGRRRRYRLLIVEDNDELCHYLGRTLSEEYDIRMCNNGKEALTYIGEYKPDVIISDIMMPEMRGDELCRCVKSDINTSHIPVILLTALSDDVDMIHGLSLNADEYIGKPFSIDLLKARIRAIVANRALLRSKYLGVEEPDEEGLTELDRRFLSDVRRHIEEHIDEQEFNVDALCRLLNMSRTGFYNKLKALTGRAPADHIRIVRLCMAAKLLCDGRYSVTEVSDMTGFNDAKYFREVFKRHFNVPPARYCRERNMR